MKKFFLGAAAALAIAAPAHAATTGYIGLAGGSVNPDPGSDSSFWSFEGSMTGMLNNEIGLSGDIGMTDLEHADATYTGTAHLFFDKKDDHLIGAFLGGTNTDITDSWDGGVEGQLYLSNATLGAAVTYVNADTTNVDGWGINGNGKYFINDNFSVGANLGWFSLDNNITNNDSWIGGVGAEYQLASVPISFVAGYEHFDGDKTNLTVDTWSLGVRYNVGTTLKTRSTSGGDLADLSGLGAVKF